MMILPIWLLYLTLVDGKRYKLQFTLLNRINNHQLLNQQFAKQSCRVASIFTSFLLCTERNFFGNSLKGVLVRTSSFRAVGVLVKPLASPRRDKRCARIQAIFGPFRPKTLCLDPLFRVGDPLSDHQNQFFLKYNYFLPLYIFYYLDQF